MADKRIHLNPGDVELLRRPVSGSGGMQSLLRTLQGKLSGDGELTLTDDELRRIRHYVEDYGEGGFQSRLKMILRYIATPGQGLSDTW